MPAAGCKRYSVDVDHPLQDCPRAVFFFPHSGEFSFLSVLLCCSLFFFTLGLRGFLVPPSRARPLLRGRLRTAATSTQKNLKHVQFHSNISVPRAWSRDSCKGTDREDTCPKEWCHTLRLKQKLTAPSWGTGLFRPGVSWPRSLASLREHFLDRWPSIQ